MEIGLDLNKIAMKRLSCTCSVVKRLSYTCIVHFSNVLHSNM